MIHNSASTTRREFVRTTSAAAAGLTLALHHDLIAAAAPKLATLKIGLIGCGNRGTSAAIEAMRADPHVELIALGDIFQDKLDKCLRVLRKTMPEKVTVSPDRCFLGFDAYQRVIDSGVDVVLLTTPPAFRPRHLKAAVEAGKHSFCECIAAVDAPGIRSFLQSAEIAGRNNLGILSGFCWRYNFPARGLAEQIRKGTIGEVRAIYATYYRQSFSGKYGGKRDPRWSDLEWQFRDWPDFLWLGGDMTIGLSGGHSVDKLAWWMDDVTPAKAVAVGGRQCPGEGNTFDHCQVIYEFANGVRGFLGVRSQDGCHNENNDYVIGSNGIGTIRDGEAEITGAQSWRYTGPKNRMTQTEHDEFFASIRAGKPINDGKRMAHTSLMTIMGRMAAYTGQEITWDQALNSKESLVPEKLDWNTKIELTPVAVPGVTKFA